MADLSFCHVVDRCICQLTRYPRVRMPVFRLNQQPYFAPHPFGFLSESLLGMLDFWVHGISPNECLNGILLWAVDVGSISSRIYSVHEQKSIPSRQL